MTDEVLSLSGNRTDRYGKAADERPSDLQGIEVGNGPAERRLNRRSHDVPSTAVAASCQAEARPAKPGRYLRGWRTGARGASVAGTTGRRVRAFLARNACARLRESSQGHGALLLPAVQRVARNKVQNPPVPLILP